MKPKNTFERTRGGNKSTDLTNLATIFDPEIRTTTRNLEKPGLVNILQAFQHTNLQKQGIEKNGKSRILYEIPGKLSLPLGYKHKIVSPEAVKFLNSKVKESENIAENEKLNSISILRKYTIKNIPQINHTSNENINRNTNISPRASEIDKPKKPILPKIRNSHESASCLISNKNNQCVFTITRDPLNREIEEVFK